MLDLATIIVVVISGLVILGLFINKKLSLFLEKQKPSNDLIEWLKSTNQRLEGQNKVFTQTLQQHGEALNKRLDNAARVISQVQRNIGEMSEIGRGMKELQEFLQSPKLRGNIGEQVLKDLISQMFPKGSFYLQHTFKSGEKVDAAIKTSAGILPIDSKFPMENFQKMIKAKDSKDKTSYKI